MRPWLLRPACVGSDSSKVFSGSLAVTSSKPDTDMKRRPGLVGLNFLIGTFSDAPEQAFDLLTGAEGDDCLLPIGGVADRSDPALAAASLAAHGHGVHVTHLDALGLVLLLEGFLDVGLRGAR